VSGSSDVLQIVEEEEHKDNVISDVVGNLSFNSDNIDVKESNVGFVTADIPSAVADNV
jgi:hypothetical protein